MSTIFSFISFVFWIVVIAAAVMAFLAFRGYNGLRLLSENVKEAWSNIGVTVRKQASLINQLINVVSSYAEGEKLVMLKVSEDASLGSVQQMHQQGGVVLSAVSGMAQRFPDLKANGQYVSLMNSIQSVEDQLEKQRQFYNAATKIYNVRRKSIPDVFYANLLGFNEAQYLDFDGASERDAKALNEFVTDDGERLNQMLANAGNKVLTVSHQVGTAAVHHGKQLANAAKEKVDEVRQREITGPATGAVRGDDTDATVMMAPRAVPSVVDIGGSANGKTTLLPSAGLVIGRAATADIVVSDPQVSKHHAWLGLADGQWVVRDQGSSNGTYAGSDLESRITELPLSHDLVLTLGAHGATRFRIVFA